MVTNQGKTAARFVLTWPVDCMYVLYAQIRHGLTNSWIKYGICISYVNILFIANGIGFHVFNSALSFIHEFNVTNWN